MRENVFTKCDNKQPNLGIVDQNIMLQAAADKLQVLLKLIYIECTHYDIYS